MLADKLRSATAGEKLFVEDVFGVNLGDGTGTTRTAVGPDMTKGGLVITKARSTTTGWRWVDTARGAGKSLESNSAALEATESTGLTSFTSTGASFGDDADYNASGQIFVDYLIRKAPKFFDVVTYTGNGTSGRSISHSLGVAPGMIIVKQLTTTLRNWGVYHRSLTAGQVLVLQTTGAAASSTEYFTTTSPTDSVFYLGNNANTNASGESYVAYLFAHDTATDGMIQCGSFTGGGFGVPVTVTLGWEPQYVLVKASGTTGDWYLTDSMRGMAQASSGSFLLSPNVTSVESPSNVAKATATGFVAEVTNATTNIYLAIRRPNKPPTTGTQVFSPTVYTGTNVDNRLINTGILTDMVWLRQRNGSSTGYEGFVVGDRLRGQPWLKTGATQAEQTVADGLDQQLVSAVEYGTAFSSMTGVWVGNNAGAVLANTNVNANTTSNNHVALAFKRAPGFFDVVTYVGTGAAQTVPHNLGATPELILVRRRILDNWFVYYGDNTRALYLNMIDAFYTGTSYWNNTSPTNTTFSVGVFTSTGSVNYIAYLFATLPGISKVGTYTGNGSTQTIDCGFTTGARFVMIKRVDSGGDWYVFDVARGIVAGNDPFLSPNLTATENGANDVIDPDNSGFVVNNIGLFNATGATFLYLAIA